MVEGSAEGRGVTSLADPKLRSGAADRVSRIIGYVETAALAVSLILLGYLMSVPIVLRNKLGFVPGLAFWFGVPASISLFVAGYWRAERRASIITMVSAAIMGLLWLFVTFFSLALMGAGM